MRSNLLIAITLIAQLIAGNYGTETWSCAAPNAAIAISNVQIAPDPIVYPGDVAISAQLIVHRAIKPENFYVRLSLQKLQPQAMLVPCLHGVGSCWYDVCKHLLPLNAQIFEQFALKTCPFAAGTYAAQNVRFQLPNLGGPIFRRLMDGHFEGNLTFFDRATSEIFGCVGMKFTLSVN